MSIATAINDLSGRIQDAYDSVEEMGGTIPQTKNSYNLPTAIESIPQGGNPAYGIDGVGLFGEVQNGALIAPSESQSLVMTGVSNISNQRLAYGLYNSIGVSEVQFPDLTSIPQNGLQYFGVQSEVKKFSADSVTSISQNGLRNAFRSSSIEDISMENLTAIDQRGGNYFCNNCNSIKRVNLPNLTTVGEYGLQYAFTATTSGSNSPISLSFPKLRSIGNGGMSSSFQYYNNITNISFPVLETVGDGAFAASMPLGTQSHPIESLTFPALTSISYACFSYYQSSRTAHKYVLNAYFPEVVSIVGAYTQTDNSVLTLSQFSRTNYLGTTRAATLYFPKCQQITNTYLFGSGQWVSLHFAAANKSAIEATDGYSIMWGANTTYSSVSFDL